MEKKTVTRKPSSLYPAMLTREERLVVLQKLKGAWKHRKPDPIKELNKMRKEWERKFTGAGNMI
jgi:hypothetical protein